MKLQERLDNLINQREGLKENYIKVCGAIELVQSLIKDKEDDGKKETAKKEK